MPGVQLAKLEFFDRPEVPDISLQADALHMAIISYTHQSLEKVSSQQNEQAIIDLKTTPST
jgi:hypothetical protein